MVQVCMQLRRYLSLSLLFISPAIFSIFVSAAGLGPVTFRTKNTCQSLLEFKSDLRLSVVQYAMSGGLSFADFQNKVRAQVLSAKQAGSELVVFPELFTLDLIRPNSSETDEVAEIAKTWTPQIWRWLTELAREQQIAILAGSSPRYVKEKIVNTAALIFPDGQIQLQDKIFLTPSEREWGWSAGSDLKVFSSPWGRMAILICHDCEFPKISQALAKHRPEIILVPSMTSDQTGFQRVRWTAQARAIEHAAYVIHTGTVEPRQNLLPGWSHYGQAGVFSPSDSSKGFFGLVEESKKINEEALLNLHLDMAKLRDTRDHLGIYPARDQELGAP